MSYHQQKMLVYREREDDIATISRALDWLRQGNTADATRVLVVYLHYLQEDQKPEVVDYDPHLEQQRAQR